MESEPFKERPIYHRDFHKIPSIVFLRDGRLVVVSSTHIHLLEEVPTNNGESWSQARAVSRIRTSPNIDDDKRRFVSLAQHDLEIHIFHQDTIDFAPVLWVDTIRFQTATSVTSLYPGVPELKLDNIRRDRVDSYVRSVAIDSSRKQVFVYSEKEVSAGSISVHETSHFDPLSNYSLRGIGEGCRLHC